MSRRHDIHDATGRIEYLSGRGTVEAWGTGAPSSSTTGFAPGCIYHRVDGGANTSLYVNEGTFSSSTWVPVTTAGATLATLTVTSLTATTAVITTATLTTPTVTGVLTTGTSIVQTIGASTGAAGSTTTDAGVLPAGTGTVYPTTAADDTAGVRVSATDKVTGRTLFIGNGVANKILKVYAPSGGTINGGSADAAFSSVSGKGVIIICLSGSGNTWLAF